MLTTLVRRRRATRNARRGARDGSTITELLVGLVLLTIGLIGTAGTAGVLTRHTAVAARAERATSLAVARLAALRAAGCVAGNGSQTDGPLTVSWTVRTASRFARADISVTWRERGDPRAQHYSAGFLC